MNTFQQYYSFIILEDSCTRRCWKLIGSHKFNLNLWDSITSPALSEIEGFQNDNNNILMKS
jgi:hypothetical protein